MSELPRGVARRQLAVASFALFVGVVAVYGSGLRNGFVYDDHEVVLAQPAPRSLGDFAAIFSEPHGLPLSQLPYYRAVPRATLLGQKTLHGDVALPFHLVNALLAGATAVIVFALLRLPVFGIGPAAAALAAALFAVHPVASSCVHPISSGRETLLPAAFMLLAVHGHLSGRRWLATCSFAIALLGKEQAVIVPLVFVVADALGLTRHPPSGPASWVRRLAPEAAVLVAYIAVRAAIFGRLGDDSGFPEILADPLGPLWSLGFAMQSLVVPFRELRYEPGLTTWLAPGRLALAVAAFAGGGVWLWRLRADSRRVLSFCAAWFLIGLALTANVLPQETPYAERFLLFASFGPIAALAMGASRLAQRPAFAVAVTGAAGIALVAAAAITVHRASYFRDDLAFHTRWVATAPDHANAHYGLGTALARAGREREALHELREAVSLAPDHGNAHFNLAVLLAGQGRTIEAAHHFREKLRIDPDDAEAARNLDRLSGLAR